MKAAAEMKGVFFASALTLQCNASQKHVLSGLPNANFVFPKSNDLQI
jgi:hypothetical protein